MAGTEDQSHSSEINLSKAMRPHEVASGFLLTSSGSLSLLRQDGVSLTTDHSEATSLRFLFELKNGKIFEIVGHKR